MTARYLTSAPAGGRASTGAIPWLRHLLLLKPKCSKRIGCDVDAAVMGNRMLDEAHVLDERQGHRIPLPDESVGLVLADWVIEHLEDPILTFREIHRVLRPGGWFCARTGNLRHYSYALARVVVAGSPLESRTLHRVQPDREDRDVFPKVFRANTKRALRKTLVSAGFRETSVLIHEWEPSLHTSTSIPLPCCWAPCTSGLPASGCFRPQHC